MRLLINTVLICMLALFAGCASYDAAHRISETRFPPLPAAAHEGPEKAFKSAMDAYKTGDMQMALRIGRLVTEQYPNTPWYKRSLFLTERALIRLDSPSLAEAAMLRVLAEYPELADYAVYLLAEYHASRSRFTRAAALYQHLVERYPESFLVIRSGFRRAQALIDSSSYTPASEAFAQFIRDNPQSEFAPEAGLGLGRALLSEIKPADAVRAYQDVFIHYPGNSYDQEVEKAFTFFRQSGVEVPELTPDEMYERGRNLFRTKQYEKTAAAFAAVLEKEPNYPQRADILLKTGISLFHLGRRSEAASLLERTVKDHSTEGRGAEALNWLGKAYSKIGDRERAVQAYLKIVAAYPESEWADDALFLIGNVYREANDIKKALKFYGRLDEDFPGSSFADSAIWWKAWAYYTTGDFKKAEQTLRELIAGYPRSFLVNQAIYWQGRAAEKAGDAAHAVAYYRNVLKRGPYTYYGYCAAERLSSIEAPVQTVNAGVDPDGNADAEYAGAADLPQEWDDADGPPVWADEALRALSAEPSFNKTLELVHLDMRNEAAAELWALREKTANKRGALLGLSKTFFELGDYYRSLILVLRNYERYLEGPAVETPQDFWLLAYPQAYWDSIVSSARKYDQDPYFIAAIIRQESHFQTDAISPSGARGIMQVMPSTGEWVAQMLKLAGFEQGKLFEYDTNINIGTWYVSRLMKQFKNDLLLAAAAYNAGPAAVSSWLGKNGAFVERDEFVETIPFAETRWYVKRVLSNYAEYKRIYGKMGGQGIRIPALGSGRITGSITGDEDAKTP